VKANSGRLLVTPVPCRFDKSHLLFVRFYNTTFFLFPSLLSYHLGYYLLLYYTITLYVPASNSCQPAMEQQEQANNSAPTSTTAGQNSAQNPPTPSFPTISPPEDIATNNSSTKIDPEEDETNPTIAPTPGTANLPILAKKFSLAADDDLVNTSPWTNLSRHAITNEMVFGPIPDREYHEGFMRKAIGMAQLALDSDETPVGCVFVRDGEVIGRGINGTNASLNVSTDVLFSPHSFWRRVVTRWERELPDWYGCLGRESCWADERLGFGNSFSGCGLSKKPDYEQPPNQAYESTVLGFWDERFHKMLTLETLGHSPRRVRRSLRDHVPSPPVHLAHHRSLRDR
jgi:hypothetical protein